MVAWASLQARSGLYLKFSDMEMKLFSIDNTQLSVCLLSSGDAQ